MLKGMVDAGLGSDGFKAFGILNRRLDAITPVGMLQSFLNFASPPSANQS